MTMKTGEQMSVHPNFKEISKKIIHDWSLRHNSQIKEQKQDLTQQRLTLAYAKFLSQPLIYEQLINMRIDNLKEW